MILFSRFGGAHELYGLYIGYMEEGKSLLTVDFYSTWSGEWEGSILSGLYTLDELLKWLELNYPHHEIYHMEIP